MLKKQPVTFLILLILIFYAMPVQAMQTPSGLPAESISDRIDQFAADIVGKTSAGAAVVVFSQDEIIFSSGYGYADIDQKTPVLPDFTVFEYGSVSKLFVYTTLMQLVEAGQLDLSADINHYLPEGFLRRLRFEQPVTLFDVMNHQAGFEDLLLDIVVTDPARKIEFTDILTSQQPDQVYEPGTISAYSNYAVALAAYIAQRKLGRDFHVYQQESVFQPLNMDSTTIHPDYLDKPELKDRRAKGYEYNPESGAFREIGWGYIPLYPIGAASGTAEDLARFAMALLPPPDESGLLFEDRATLDEMLSQTLSMGPGLSGFAHGFIEYDGVFRGVGHGGNTAGFSAQLNIVPEQRFGVVVLTNTASEMKLTEGITHLLLGDLNEAKPVKPDAENLPDASLLEGAYISARRPHNGFLKLYGFLGLLHVDAVNADVIEVRLGHQSATYLQTQPYLFEQTVSNGVLFDYSFKNIYFEMQDGSVFRVSGDFTPLPAGHTIPWLMADGMLAGVSSLYFILMPLCLFAGWIIRHLRKKHRPGSQEKLTGTGQKQARRQRFLTIFVLACGFALFLNNALLIARMLIDNYRSFSEVRLQLVLNIPLAVFGAAAGIFYAYHLKQMPLKRSQRVLGAASLLMLTILLYILIKWQFVSLI